MSRKSILSGIEKSLNFNGLSTELYINFGFFPGDLSEFYFYLRPAQIAEQTINVRFQFVLDFVFCLNFPNKMVNRVCGNLSHCHHIYAPLSHECF